MPKNTLTRKEIDANLEKLWEAKEAGYMHESVYAAWIDIDDAWDWYRVLNLMDKMAKTGQRHWK